MKDLNPAEMVAVLDKTIIGQHEAKRAIAIAMRDRHRKILLPAKDKHLVETRNILLKGPSGVAKTELARILANECNFPFIKIDATSITSRGYVGGKMSTYIKRFIREGEAMYTKTVKAYMDEAKRSLQNLEFSVDDVTHVCLFYMAKFPKTDMEIQDFLKKMIALSGNLRVGEVTYYKDKVAVNREYNNDEIRELDLELKFDIKDNSDLSNGRLSICLLIWQLLDIKYGFVRYEKDDAKYIEILNGVVGLDKNKLGVYKQVAKIEKNTTKNLKKARAALKELVDWDKLIEDSKVKNTARKNTNGSEDTLAKATLLNKAIEWFKSYKSKDKRFVVNLPTELSSARSYVENYGVVFIDEIDKLVNSGGHTHATTDVQFELLKLIEGGKYNTDGDNSFAESSTGILNTENILFICAGAFVNVSEDGLISELTGRLPVRITLHPLSEENLYDILTKSDKSPLLSLQKLLAVDGINLVLTDGAIRAIARLAYRYNEQDINLGARRLQSILSMVTSEYSYEISISADACKVVIDEEAVKRTVKSFYDNNNHIYELSDRSLSVDGWAKFIKNNRSSPVHIERIKYIHKEDVTVIDIQLARLLGAAVYATFQWASEPKPIIKRIFESLFEGEGELGDFPKYISEVLGQILPRDITNSGNIHLTKEDRVAMDIIGNIVGIDNVKAVSKGEWIVNNS